MADVKIFAWDGVQFPIPRDWDLATYRYRQHGADLVIEDPFEVRLEVEWQARIDPAAIEQGKKRYHKLSAQLERVALKSKQLDDMPQDWCVIQYWMKDKRRLFTAFWTGPADFGLACIRLHVPAEQDSKQANRLCKGLLKGFTWQAGSHTAWRLYDLELKIPSQLKLRQTSFLAGRKMMIFECRMRRLMVWHFSLASRLLERLELADFIADFINRSRELPGVQVDKISADKLRIRKKPIHLFGHYEDIGRWCFRYHLDYRLDRDRDTITIIVFHYRSAADLNWLRELRI